VSLPASMMRFAPTRNAIPASKHFLATRAVLTALVCSVFLSGCLLTRLYAFKQQFCDYQANFAFSTEDNFRVTLSHPILFDRDVIFLAGAEPTASNEQPESRHLQWRVDKVLPPGAANDPYFDELLTEMDFIRDEDDFLLQQVIMDKRFAYVLSPDLMSRHASNVCSSSWLVLGRSGEIDLGDADLSNQPRRQEIIDYLGQPTAITDEGMGILFEYRLRGSKSKDPQYSFAFWHDPETGELLRSATTSIRFVSTTDFVQKKLWVRIK
jgi:hypothetical protein